MTIVIKSEHVVERTMVVMVGITIDTAEWFRFLAQKAKRNLGEEAVCHCKPAGSGLLWERAMTLRL